MGRAYLPKKKRNGSSKREGEAPDGAHHVQDNSLCDLDQIDGSPVGAHSVVDCLAKGFIDSTPGSIAGLSRKYSLDDSAHVVPSTVNLGGSLEAPAGRSLSG
ncbi:hypothetical protein Nepgr_006735 [Nepenthes gracilis]|uniref:Uncharacterized protein n=1 Tax=Nepenthes gracilis TaxID=150966 RepID=A0AAD3S5Z6_NEPGR|nr:hypothetical protein Nepgr_006735 [Nepenthes gracilis]